MDHFADRELYLSCRNSSTGYPDAGDAQMSQEPVITLSIKELGDRPNSYYQFHVLLDKSPILTNESLSVSDSGAVREISRDFGSLFE